MQNIRCCIIPCVLQKSRVTTWSGFNNIWEGKHYWFNVKIWYNKII